MALCYPHGCILFGSLPFLTLFYSTLFHASSTWTCVDCMHQYCASVTQCWHLHCSTCLRDFQCFIALFFFVGLAVFFVLFFKFCVYQTTSAAVSESIQFFNILSFFPLFCLFDLPIRPSAGIPKTQSPSSTISSLKRPLAFMSLPAAPTMLGTLTMRRTRISSGPPPQLHPCHQACTLRPHRTR